MRNKSLPQHEKTNGTLDRRLKNAVHKMLEWATAKTFQWIQFKWSFDDTFRLCPSCCLPKSYLHLTGEVRPVQKGHVTHHQLHLGLSHQAKRRLENGGLALSSHFLFTFHLSLLLLLLLLYFAPLFCHLGFFGTFFSTLFFLLFLGRLTQMLREKKEANYIKVCSSLWPSSKAWQFSLSLWRRSTKIWLYKLT